MKTYRTHFLQYIISLSIILFLVSCSAKHDITSSTKNSKLIPQKSIYIALAKDGTYNNTIYPGSGSKTSTALFKSFSMYTNKIEIANQYKPYSAALTQARRNGAIYFIYPTIFGWEDRATEWSGKPDKISIQIKTIKTNTGIILNSTIIEGKSAWATLGGDHPEDLLQKPINDLINSLY